MAESGMIESEITAYCVRCRAIRPMQDAQAVYMTNGRPATRGVCGTCGTGLFKLGRTVAHDALPQPAIQKVETPAGKGAKAGEAKPARAATKRKAGAAGAAETGLPAASQAKGTGKPVAGKTAGGKAAAGKATKATTATGKTGVAKAGAGKDRRGQGCRRKNRQGPSREEQFK